jgi:hypothetical protein
VNLLGDNLDTKKKKTETLIDTSREVRLEVNTAETKYTFMSHLQNGGKNHDIKIADRCYENVAQFKYLGITVKKLSP